MNGTAHIYLRYMNRRAFLTLIGAGAAATQVPAATVAAQVPTTLATPERMVDQKLGISIRYIREYDIRADVWKHHIEQEGRMGKKKSGGKRTGY